MSEGVSHCEIAAAWSDQRSYPALIKVWRPRRAPPAPVLPADGPHTREEMQAAHKARQARIAAAGQRLIEEQQAAIRRAKELQVEIMAQAAEKRKVAALSDAFGQIALPSICRIVAGVAKVFGVTPLDIISHRRTADVILPRHVVMYLAKVTTMKSLPEIGRALYRDHTTIISAVRKIAARMAVDDAFKAKVEALRAAIEGRE